MSFATSVTLPDDAAAAEALFKSYLGDPNRGLAVVLGDDPSNAFGRLVGHEDLDDPTVSVIWAKNPTAIQADIAGLQGGSAVDFGSTGTKVVIINRIKVVTDCLDEDEAADDLTLTIDFSDAGDFE